MYIIFSILLNLLNKSGMATSVHCAPNNYPPLCPSCVLAAPENESVVVSQTWLPTPVSRCFFPASLAAEERHGTLSGQWVLKACFPGRLLGKAVVTWRKPRCTSFLLLGVLVCAVSAWDHEDHLIAMKSSEWKPKAHVLRTAEWRDGKNQDAR